MRKVQNCLTITLTILLLLACVQTGFSQSQDENLLEQQVRNLEVKERTVSSTLSTIARKYKIPIGLETVTNESTSLGGEMIIAIKDGTMRDLLNAVVEHDPRYEWKVVEGVINFFPKKSRDSFLEDLLASRVQRFTVQKGASRLSIRHDITELPEVKTKLQRANVLSVVIGFSLVDRVVIGQEFSLNVSDVTVRNILNQIVKDSDSKYWVMSRFGENNCFLVVNF